MLLEWLDGLSAKLRSAARRSRLLSALSGDSDGGAPARARAASDACGRIGCGIRTMRRWLPFRRSVLQMQEESIFRCWIRSAFQWTMAGSLGSLGVFLLLLGGTSLCICWLTEPQAPTWMHQLALLVPVAASVPLLHSAESISSGIRNGFLLRRFFLVFCAVPQAVFGSRDMGEDRRIVPVLLGILFGLLSAAVQPVWIALLILLPPAFALLFAVPELSLLAVMLMLPFFNLFPHPSVSLACAAAVCDATWLGKLISGKRQLRFTVADLPVFLFAALLVLGGAVGYGSYITGLLRAFLLLSAWIPIRALPSSALWRKRCLGALRLSALICAAVGVWQYATGRGELRWVDASRFGDIGGRVCALFDNPNVLAVFLLLTAPLSLGVLAAPGGRSRRAWAAFCFAVESLCTVFTWSRGAWLGWIAALLIFLLCFSRRSLALLLLLPAPTATLLPYLPHSVVNRFGSIGSITESSIRYRYSTWRGVLRMIRAKPWGIGCGEDAFRAVFPKFAVSGTERVMHAHQLFLQVLAELGIPGFAVLAVILLCLLRRAAVFCRRETQPEKRAWLLGLAGALTGALVMGLFDDIWYHNGLFWLFWAICAFLLNGAGDGEERWNDTE